MKTKLTVQEAKDFLNDHTDSDVLFDDNSNFQSEIKSLVLQDNDLEKLIDFLDQQQAEITKQEALYLEKQEELENLSADYVLLSERNKNTLIENIELKAELNKVRRMPIGKRILK